MEQRTRSGGWYRDLATAMMPNLLAERMDKIGIDYSIIDRARYCSTEIPRRRKIGIMTFANLSRSLSAFPVAAS